jgi:CubicO group peptidase (beta-lactamase class C family)
MYYKFPARGFRGSVSLIAFILGSFLATGQNPSFTNPDTSRHNSVRIENAKKREEEKQKEDLARKNQAIEIEKITAAGGIPMIAAVQDLPATTPAFIRDSLDSYIQRGMKQWQIPGLAITIVKDGKVVFSKGYGVTELGRTDPVNENTLFIIASNTKLFTGTALAKLDFEKKLSLNDKITKYLPWFRLYDTNSTKLANIRDMLCHRIGLKTFQGDFTFWDSNLAKDSIIWKMRYLKPSGDFRQDYGYCNSAFLVAGRVLEKVTGKTWESYVEENILAPLGMTNTYMNTAGLAVRPNVAQPHNNQYGPLSTIPFDNVDNLGPATSMVSNIKDLGKWLMLQLDSGRYEGRQVIPWAVLQKTRDINILTGSRRSPYYPTHFRGYGLGVYSTDYNARQVYWHTGGAFGHVTNVCFVPEEKLGISILTNNDNQSFFEALRYQVMDAYLGVPYTDRSQFQWGFYVQGKKETDDSIASLKARVDKKNTPAIKLDDFTGNYYNTVYGRITVSKNGESLLCKFQRHPDLIGYMEYMDNNEFRITYSNIGYGIYPAKFSLKNGKPWGLEIQVNDFVESDAYLFVKDPKGIVVK